MTKKSKPPVSKNMHPGPGVECAECIMGSPTYIPCRQPATFVVMGTDKVCLPMCGLCADHNVSNRRARYVQQGEEVHILTVADVLKSFSNPPVEVEAAEDAGEAAGPTAEQVENISHLVSRGLKLQELLIPEAEAHLAKLHAELKELTEITLPNAMTNARTSGWVYKDRNDGEWETALVEDVKFSIKKDNLSKFIGWLEKKKDDAIVKRTIVIKFGRDQVKAAKKFLADLAKRKVDLHPEIKEEIHYQTLQAYCKGERETFIQKGLNPDEALPDTVDQFKLRYATFEKKERKKGVAAFDG